MQTRMNILAAVAALAIVLLHAFHGGFLGGGDRAGECIGLSRRGNWLEKNDSERGDCR